jgi:hypothetical protein
VSRYYRRRHSVGWWLLIGWWWVPVKWVLFFEWLKLAARGASY